MTTKITPRTFSIITITRNNRNGLKKTSHSIMEQGCTDYEWIIIDGASTDATANDFKNYTVTKIISEPDSGIYDAMNKGINCANGQYLIFMNAGDRFATPDTLEKTSAAINDKSPDLIYGDAYEEDGNGELFLKRTKPHTTIERGMFTHHQAIFYSRTALNNMRYNTDYKIAADYDLTLNFLTKGARTCLKLDFPVCIFEMGGISQQNIALGRHEQFIARQKNGVPLLKNLTITTKQKAASLIRRLYPFLYRMVKS